MSEKKNALVRYSESQRDQIEAQLSADANKRELDARSFNGITVIAYWLVAENVTTIYVEDERVNSAAEFEVPPEQVMEYFQHPFAHPDAELKPLIWTPGQKDVL